MAGDLFVCGAGEPEFEFVRPVAPINKVSMTVDERRRDPAALAIDDPLGGTPDVYRACAGQIWENLRALLPELNNGQGSPAAGCRD